MRELCRLAVRMRRPLAEVMAWPSWHVDLLLEFTAREPVPEERTEFAIARLTALLTNHWRAKGEPAKSFTDFLMFRDAWNRQESISPSDVDAQLFARIDAIGRRHKE